MCKITAGFLFDRPVRCDRIQIPEDNCAILEKLSHFLDSVADAWKEATQEQRNRLAKSLFEEIIIEDNKVISVKPTTELEPFFELNLECHTRDIAGDPGGIRTPDLHRDRVAC